MIARVRDEEAFTGADLSAQLAQLRGWMVPAYHLPPANEDTEILRVLVKINQTRELADALAADVSEAIGNLRKRAAGEPVTPRVHRGHGY